MEPRVRCIWKIGLRFLSMLRLFDVKGNVQQAKHRSIKCDEPGEVRRAWSGGRQRREGGASLAAAAVKNAVYGIGCTSFQVQRWTSSSAIWMCLCASKLSSGNLSGVG